MAWSFSDEIHALAGYDADSTDATASGETFAVHTNRWLTEGAKEVIKSLPSDLQKLCTSVQSFTSAAAGSEAETLSTGKIFSVFAGSVSCRLIANTDKYRAEDSGDFLYATSTDPAYYIESNYINVLPTSLSCKYEEVQYPSVANTDTAIAVFPDEAEHLVVLYAAMKALQYRMQIKSSDLPSDSDLNAVPPDVPTLSSITFGSIDSDINASLPTYTTATVSAGGVYGANTAPAYTKPTITARVAFASYWTVGDFGDSDPGALSITAVPPDVPTLGTTSVTITGTAPTYDNDIANTEIGEVSTELDNEDIELASARINEAQLIIQNELNEFNEDQIEYQALLQKDLRDAEFDNQEDARKLQKFQAEISEYQAEVNTQVQEYSQKLSRYQLELNTVYQAWAKTESDSLQQYSVDIQNELNEYNKENISFQANIQEAVQEIQTANQVNIAKAQGELQLNMDNENRSQQREFQNAINDMQAIAQNNQSLISKYTSESQAYTAEIGAQVQEFTTKMQKHTTDYQWLQGQHAALKIDYDAGLTALKGQAVAEGGA